MNFPRKEVCDMCLLFVRSVTPLHNKKTREGFLVNSKERDKQKKKKEKR